MTTQTTPKRYASEYPEPKFYNKDGSLTVYSFACGYVQRENGWDLHKDGCWHVQGHGEWYSFDTLTEARKEWRRLVKLAKSQTFNLEAEVESAG